MSTLKSYRLVAPDFLHPLWMQSFRGQVQDGEVADGGVKVQGVSLSFARPVPEFAEGTLVKVWVDFHFLCAESSELARHEAALSDAANSRTRAERRTRAHSAVGDEHFNQALKVPVAWRVGIKDVLSGLSENSDGSGRNRASVSHILLLSELHDGRIHRHAGDVLCTSRSQSNGKNWSNQREEGRGRVTCPRCLQLAAKWAAPTR